MATKVNVRFVVILGMAVCTAVGIVGGLYYLHLRQDASRNIRRGDEAVAAGDLKRAFDNYGRAVHKEPGNMEAIRKLEDTVLKIIPQTADEANNYYRDRIGVLQHKVRHNPTNAETHLALLEELSRSARLGGGNGMWPMVRGAADEMWRQLPESDPNRPLAKVYSTMATFRMATQRSRDELQEAELEAKTAVQALPTNDLAWANLIYGQQVLAEKMRLDGRSQSEVADKERDAFETTAKAAEAVTDGPEVLRLVLWAKSFQRMRTPDEVSEQDLIDLSDKLVKLLTASDVDPAVSSECAEVLIKVPAKGSYDRTTLVLDDALARHPDAIDKRLARGSFRFLMNQWPEAEADANDILNAPLLPTSFLAQLQFAIKQRAAALLVDIAHRRWTAAEEADRPAALAAVEQARDRLLAMGIDRNDPLVIRADAKIAYSKSEFARATSLFERLAEDPATANDEEVLLYAAQCLESVGEVGLAYSRLTSAMKLQPYYNPRLIFNKARLEYRLARPAEASATLQTLTESDRAKPEVQQLAQAIAARQDTLASTPAPGSPGAAPGTPGVANVTPADPVTAAIMAAEDALAKGNPDAARTVLQAALAKDPENLTLNIAAGEIELRLGQPDAARPFVEKAKAKDPNNDLVRRLDIVMRYGDSVEAAVKYIEITTPDPALQAVALSINLDAVAARHRAMVDTIQNRTHANEKERTEAAKKVTEWKDIADRAAKESAVWTAKAKELAPENPQFLEFQFNKALYASDWPAAEAIIVKAKALNLDQVDGDLYRGRMELARGNYKEAVRILESVTDRVAFLSGAWRLLAGAYQGAGNYTQSIRAFEKAYNANPLDLDTTRYYVQALINVGDQTRALTIVRSTRLLAPRDVSIRNLWLDQEAAVGDKVLALRERRRIYKETPEDRDNAMALARLLGRMDPTRELMVDQSGNHIYNTQRWLHMTAQEQGDAVAEARTAWRAESDAVIAQISKDATDDLSFAITRAQLLQARADVAGGERVLREFIARNSSAPTSQMYIELAKYLSDNVQYVKAKDVLLEGVQYQDPKQREINQALSRLYMQLSLYAEAAAELEKVQEVNPNRTTQLQLVECLMRLRKFDQAEAMLKKVIGESEDMLTVLLAASLSEGQALAMLDQGQSTAAERKFAEQRDMLARAESLDPGSPTPRVLLAQSFLNEFSRTRRASLLDDALLQLEKADSIRADFEDTSKVRVEVLKARGDNDALAAELTRMLQRNPDNPHARQALTQLYVDNRQYDLAKKSLEEAIATNPSLPFWYEALGDLNARLFVDAVAANKAYARAYALEPTAGRFNRVMETALGMSPPDNAGVIREIEQHPDYMKEMPRIRLSYARALHGLKRRDDALAQVKQAYADIKTQVAAGTTHPDEQITWFMAMRFLFSSNQVQDVEALLMEVTNNQPSSEELRQMARTWLATGVTGHARAQELHRRAIDACAAPACDAALKLELYREMADIYLVSQNFEAAAEAYRQVLAMKPDFVSVLNNLSYMMAENMGQAEQAIAVAERAVSLAPRDPTILDTAGWVYFRANKLDLAEQALRQSLSINDNAYETHYHMAEVQAAKGDNTAARGHLQKAIELKAGPDTRQKIDRLLDDIRNKP